MHRIGDARKGFLVQRVESLPPLGIEGHGDFQDLIAMAVEGGQHPGFVRTETGVQIHQYAVFHKESNFACVVVTPCLVPS